MGTTVRKISISIDAEVHAWAIETAKREGRSLSSVIDAALRMERQNAAALRVVERIGARATPEEAEALLREWIASPSRARRGAKPRATKGKPAPERSWRRKSA